MKNASLIAPRSEPRMKSSCHSFCLSVKVRTTTRKGPHTKQMRAEKILKRRGGAIHHALDLEAFKTGVGELSVQEPTVNIRVY